MKEVLIARSLNISTIDRMVFGILYFILLIDSINGFFMHLNANIPISQFFKFILMGLMSFRLMTCKYGRLLIWISFFYIAVLFWIYSFRGDLEVFATFIHLFKYLISVWTYFYFRQLISLDTRYIYNLILKIIKINAIVLIGNILLGLIGLGATTYETVGSKGYFYAGNEISGIIIVLFPIYLYYIGHKQTFQSKKYYTFLALLFLTGFLLGTKTALIAIFLSAVFVPSFSINKSKNKNIIKKIFIGIAGLILILLIGYILTNKVGLLDRWTYIYNKGGIISLLLSGRDKFWFNKRDELFESGLGGILFGLGEVRGVEMDPFDALLNYGVIGLIMVYVYYFYLLVISFKYRRRNSMAQLIFFVNIVLLAASSLSGHIVFSGMAGPFVALANVLIFVPDGMIKKETL